MATEGPFIEFLVSRKDGDFWNDDVLTAKPRSVPWADIEDPGDCGFVVDETRFDLFQEMPGFIVRVRGGRLTPDEVRAVVRDVVARIESVTWIAATLTEC